MTRFPPWTVLFVLLLATRANAVTVATTVKPLHSIASAVMQGVSTPELLLEGRVSPHIDRVKPSTLRKLRSADLVIWIGPGLESFLAPAIADLPEATQVLTLSEVDLPVRLTMRDAPSNAPAGPIDPHLWIDPVNAAAIAQVMADELARMDAANADTYQSNTNEFKVQMQQLTATSSDILAALADTPFVLFHDFIQYFENRFALNNAGVVTYQPQVSPGARHLKSLNRIIKDLGVHCILSEPQFEDRAIRTLSTSSVVSYTVVDPLASTFEPGPALYATWFTDTVLAIRDCLGSS